MTSGELAMDIHIESGPSSRGKEVAKACHTRDDGYYVMKPQLNLSCLVT